MSCGVPYLSFLLVGLACGASGLRAEDLTLTFGTGPGQVGVLTAAEHPGALGMPLPLGPSALRAERDRLYLLDGGNRRLLRFEDGRPTGTIALDLGGTLPWLGDLALARGPDGRIDRIWVVDRLDAALLAFDPAGKQVRKLGGADDATSPLRDPRRLEIGPSGRLYVADEGAGGILVLDPAGALLRSYPTAARGFSLDADETLSFLAWNEGDGTLALRREGPDGPRAPPLPLGLSSAGAPELWGRLASGSLLLSLPPPEPDQGTAQLVWCGADGRPRGRLDLAAPEGMIRAVVPAEGDSVWLVEGDLAAAPRGEVRVRRLDLAVPPEG